MRLAGVEYPDVERLREDVPVSPGWPKPTIAPFVSPKPAVVSPPELDVIEDRRLVAEREASDWMLA